MKEEEPLAKEEEIKEQQQKSIVQEETKSEAVTSEMEVDDSDVKADSTTETTNTIETEGHKDDAAEVKEEVWYFTKFMFEYVQNMYPTFEYMLTR